MLMTLTKPQRPLPDGSQDVSRHSSTGRCLVPGLLIAALTLFVWNPPATSQTKAAMHGPLDAERCFKYLTDICAIGSRPSGSPGMAKQQKLITEHFAKF